MKKILSTIICATALAAALSACGTEKAPAPTPEAESEILNQTAAESGEESTELKFTQEKVVKKDKFLENEAYSDFLSRSEQEFLVPGLAQFIIPQGITFDAQSSHVFISNYSAVPDAPSTVAAVDAKSGKITGEFPVFNSDGTPFTSHMGGIAAAGDYVYVSAGSDGDNYRIAKLSLEDLTRQGRHEVEVKEFINVQTSPSFINCSGGYLWVGNFYHPNGKYELPRTFDKPFENDGTEYGCVILAYKTDENGNLKMGEKYPEPSFAVLAPDKIQGMCFDGSNIYLSQSYGRKSDSTIIVHGFNPEDEPKLVADICGAEVNTYVLDSKNFVEAITAMPMTEGLSLDADNNILVLFESGAGKYDDGRDRTDFVWKLKLN